MDERVCGTVGSGASAGRRRRLRAMFRGYRMRLWIGSIVGIAAWMTMLSPMMAQELVMSGSRYSAPLWTWIAAIVVSVALSAVGLLIGLWFLRKRSRMESSE